MWEGLCVNAADKKTIESQAASTQKEKTALEIPVEAAC